MISLLLRPLQLFEAPQFLLAISKFRSFAIDCFCHLSPGLIWISIREKAFGKAWKYSSS